MRRATSRAKLLPSFMMPSLSERSSPSDTTLPAGIYTALVTPMRGANASVVDMAAFEGLCRWQCARGVRGLVVAGTTGEAAALADEEYGALVRAAVDAVAATGNGVVMAGVGGASTAHAVGLAKRAKAEGARVLLAITPYYVRPGTEGLLRHYAEIYAASALPLVVYNAPRRTGCDLDVETLLALSARVPVAAVKESSASVARIQDIRQACGDALRIFSGDDALCLPALAAGADGIVSVTSNVAPGRMCEVVRAFERGDVRTAQAQHRALLPLHAALFAEPSPAPAKWLLSELVRETAGNWPFPPEPRLPMVVPSTALQQRLRTLASELNLAAEFGDGAASR